MITSKPMKHVIPPPAKKTLEDELYDVVEKIENRFKNLKAKRYEIYSFGSYNTKEFGENSDIDLIAIADKQTIDKIAVEENKEDTEKISVGYASFDWFKNIEQFKGGILLKKSKLDCSGLASKVLLYYIVNTSKRISGTREKKILHKLEKTSPIIRKTFKYHPDFINKFKKCITNYINGEEEKDENIKGTIATLERRYKNFISKFKGKHILADLKKDPRLAKNKADPKEGYELFIASTRDLIDGKISKAVLRAAYAVNLVFGMGFLDMYKEIPDIKEMFFGLPQYKKHSKLIDDAYEFKKQGKDFDLTKDNINLIWDYFNLIRKSLNIKAKELQYGADKESLERLDYYFNRTTPAVVRNLDDLIKKYGDDAKPLTYFYAEELVGFFKNEFHKSSVIKKLKIDNDNVKKILEDVLDYSKDSTALETRLLTARINLVLEKYKDAADLMEGIKDEFSDDVKKKGHSKFYSYFDLDESASLSEFLQDIGRAHFGNKDFEKASEYFMDSISADPINKFTNIIYWNNILECYKQDPTKKQEAEGVGKFIANLKKAETSPAFLAYFKFNPPPNVINFDNFVAKIKEQAINKLKEFDDKIKGKLNSIDYDIKKHNTELTSGKNFKYKAAKIRIDKHEKELFEALDHKRKYVKKIFNAEDDLLEYYVPIFKSYLSLQNKIINRANSYELLSRTLDREILTMEAECSKRYRQVIKSNPEEQEKLIQHCCILGFGTRRGVF